MYSVYGDGKMMEEDMEFLKWFERKREEGKKIEEIIAEISNNLNLEEIKGVKFHYLKNKIDATMDEFQKAIFEIKKLFKGQGKVVAIIYNNFAWTVEIWEIYQNDLNNPLNTRVIFYDVLETIGGR